PAAGGANRAASPTAVRRPASKAGASAGSDPELVPLTEGDAPVLRPKKPKYRITPHSRPLQKKPGTAKPATKKPGTKKPAAKPATAKPAAAKPATKKPEAGAKDAWPPKGDGKIRIDPVRKKDSAK
ncbi:MAG: hypothetical protein II839_07650, partial [Kiritimatiellae bacterium]|nr:hypothetical protein [Kiritimatiellia bacterium]